MEKNVRTRQYQQKEVACKCGEDFIWKIPQASQITDPGQKWAAYICIPVKLTIAAVNTDHDTL